MLTKLLFLAACASATELLLPLYIHPGTGGSAWSSVRAALTNAPDVTATLVINVDNGPGSPFASSEGDSWRAGGQALGDLPNASLVGYVHCTRCQRPLADVKRDVASWASWHDQDIDINGIFIDEAPNDGSCVDYLAELTRYIRQTAGLETVVFNPGFPSTPRVMDNYYEAIQPTFVVALETCFTTASNGQDLCSGNYAVYDQAGFGSTIDSTLVDWVGEHHYEQTAVLVHGFHGSNGLFEANGQTLSQLLEAVSSRGVGAVAVTTNHWITPDAAPADIGTLVRALDAANK